MTTGHDTIDPDDGAEGALGGELIASLDPMLLLSSLARTVTPGAVLQALGRIAAQTPAALTTDTGGIPPKDSRFKDEAFRSNPLYRGWAQAYLVWERELMTLVENDDVDWRTRERSRLLLTALTTAAAPSNLLLGNPGALKEAFTTGGRSVVAGLSNLVKDVTGNRGLPAQVDTSAFTVGVDLAVTPGWVVHRTDMFELIHYTPTQPEVGRIPLVLLPPAVNKYYFWDLAPGRSLIEYAVSRGVDVFTIVWRDPRPTDGTWGIDRYLSSALTGIDVARSIAGTSTAHVFGDCSGGMFLAMLLGYEAARGERTIETGTFGVTVVDFGEPGGIGITASETSLKGLRKRADRGEVISAGSIADTFVWMRPNDLVWRYVVDEWLLGHKPPAFDIMYWNSDGQGLPSRLALEMTEMSLANSLIRPGGLTALGAPVDLGAVQIDTYHVAGVTDHISPWKACYAAATSLGGRNTFVLTPTGHVQSIIYPMGKPRAAFYTNPRLAKDPEAWFARAKRTEDSWWGHWVDWIRRRSDGTRPAPVEPGTSQYPPIAPAPGTYVRGE